MDIEGKTQDMNSSKMGNNLRNKFKKLECCNRSQWKTLSIPLTIVECLPYAREAGGNMINIPGTKEQIGGYQCGF